MSQTVRAAGRGYSRLYRLQVEGVPDCLRCSLKVSLTVKDAGRVLQTVEAGSHESPCSGCRLEVLEGVQAAGQRQPDQMTAGNICLFIAWSQPGCRGETSPAAPTTTRRVPCYMYPKTWPLSPYSQSLAFINNRTVVHL